MPSELKIECLLENYGGLLSIIRVADDLLMSFALIFVFGEQILHYRLCK